MPILSHAFEAVSRLSPLGMRGISNDINAITSDFRVCKNRSEGPPSPFLNRSGRNMAG
jgi:hypothetical protein